VSVKDEIVLLKKIIRSLFALPFVALFSLAFALSTSTSSAVSGDTEEVSSDEATDAATAIFAGGCFWCVETDFDLVPGVLKTVSGYTGGKTDNPTYKNHHRGRHREVVQITYDPSQVSYEQLLNVFWHSVDPTDGGGQFCDRGHSYTTAIYSTSPEQHSAATAAKAKLVDSGVLKDPIVTPIETAGSFWPAEDYHQDYYLKNPLRYKYYRAACGRDNRVKKVWGSSAYSGIEKS